MNKIKWPRLAALSLASLALAFLLGLQAASGVVERTDPTIATRLNPANGSAQSRLAFAIFSQGQIDQAEKMNAMRNALPWAQAAYRRDPLNSRALTVLAVAQTDAEKSRAFLNAAVALNRRSLSLQGLMLEQHAKDQDIPKFVETLDQILRVHPERLAEFNPVLIEALSKEGSVPSFVTILGNESTWHKRFLTYAATAASAAPNVAKLSREIDYQDEALHRLIIDRLGLFGQVAQAQEHLTWVEENIIAAQSLGNSASVSAWPETYPPLHWKLADKAERRAQVSRNGKEIEIFVRSGNGGELMSRIIPAPNSTNTLRISHDLSPENQLDSVRLELFCDGAEQPFQTTRFVDIDNGVSLAGMPADCGFLTMRIYGRAPTGRPAIKGAIQSIAIS